MQNSSSFPRPLSVGELLDRAFRLYRQKFGLLLLTAAVLLVPFGIISGLLTGTAMFGYFDILENTAMQPGASGPGPSEIFGPMTNFFGVMLGVGLLGLVFNGVTTLALTQQEIGLLHNEKIELKQGLRTGLRRLLAYAGMMLLQGLAYIGAFLGIAIVMGLCTAALFAIMGSSTISFGEDSVPFLLNPITAMICLYPIMFLLSLVPFLYFAGRWSVAVPALVEQELGPIEALRYSWSITKGHGRRTVIYIVLLSILSAIVVAVPATVISQLAGFFMGSLKNIAIIQSLSMIVSSLFSIIWLPLYTAAFVMLYFDLRVRKQGYDITKRVEQFESDLKPSASFGSD